MDGYRILPAAGPCRRLVGHIHIRFEVVMEGVVVSAAVGQWTRVVGWDDGLCDGQHWVLFVIAWPHVKPHGM